MTESEKMWFSNPSGYLQHNAGVHDAAQARVLRGENLLS